MPPKRIDQFLFKDIIRQSYEAHSSWCKWIEKYKIESDAERYAYEMFSKNIKKNKKDIIDIYIIDLWHQLSEQERNRMISDSKIYLYKFKNVQHMMDLYSHTMM